MKIHIRWNGTTSNSDILVNFLLLLQQCTKISENTLFSFDVVQITWNERRAWTKTNSSKIYFIITLGLSEKYHNNVYEKACLASFCHCLSVTCLLLYCFFFCIVFHHGFSSIVKSRFTNNDLSFFIKWFKAVHPITSCWSSVDMIRFSFSFRQAMLGPNIMGRNKRWYRYIWKRKNRRIPPNLPLFVQNLSWKVFHAQKQRFFNSKSELEVTVLKDWLNVSNSNNFPP